MFELPLVSIVITNYNREKSIAKAIESALEQDYPNLEIIISDNCSTDHSHHIISKYTNDKRIKYFRNDCNIGMLNNFKISYEQRASGEFITNVNSDDQLVNNSFITEAINLINKYPNVVIVKSNHIVEINNKDFVVLNDGYHEFYEGLDFLQNINLKIDFGWTGIVLKRDLLNNIKPYDLDIIAADYIANFNMLLYGNICFNKKVSYKYYLHKKNASF
jgi:glycosyltransferase involved in cell wall biosynthesis